jgi:hypothetical protein
MGIVSIAEVHCDAACAGVRGKTPLRGFIESGAARIQVEGSQCAIGSNPSRQGNRSQRAAVDAYRQRRSARVHSIALTWSYPSPLTGVKIEGRCLYQDEVYSTVIKVNARCAKSPYATHPSCIAAVRNTANRHADASN